MATNEQQLGDKLTFILWTNSHKFCGKSYRDGVKSAQK